MAKAKEKENLAEKKDLVHTAIFIRQREWTDEIVQDDNIVFASFKNSGIDTTAQIVIRDNSAWIEISGDRAFDLQERLKNQKGYYDGSKTEQEK